jgi:GxxExxY protein
LETNFFDPDAHLMEVKTMSVERENEITGNIIGGAIEVHRELGPGLLESAYEECLCYELSQAGLPFLRQQHLPLLYKRVRLDCGFRIDLLVADTVVVDLKCAKRIKPIHEAQLLTYMRLTRKRIGLILNFKVSVMTEGIKRMVNGYPSP